MKMANTHGVYLAREPNKQLLCAVCDDLASGRHYGVFTCNSCKCFYRRCQGQKCELKCHSRGSCIVNKSLRKECRACRFEKCRMVGMHPKATKKGRPPKNSYSSRAAYAKRFNKSQRRLAQLLDEIEREFVHTHQLRRDIPTLPAHFNKFDLETSREKQPQGSRRLMFPNFSDYMYQQSLRQSFNTSQEV